MEKNIDVVMKSVTRVENQKRFVFDKLKTALKEFRKGNQSADGIQAMVDAEKKMKQYFEEVAPENFVKNIKEEDLMGEELNEEMINKLTKAGKAGISYYFDKLTEFYMDNNKKAFESAIICILSMIYEVK